DEVRVARVFPLHENAVASKDRRRAEALGDFLFLEIDSGIKTETANDPSNRIPYHFDQLAAFRGGLPFSDFSRSHLVLTYRRFGIFVGRIGSSASARTLVTSRAVDTPACFSGWACGPTSCLPGSGPCLRLRSSPRTVTLLPEYFGLPFPRRVTL